VLIIHGLFLQIIFGKINTEFHDGSLSFKYDNSIILYRNILNETKSGDIYEASFSKENTWSNPKPILMKNKTVRNKINSSYFESSASISEDESYIYFISERPSGIGEADIYFIKKIGSSYTNPINLGDKINTIGDEKCVYIHPSGQILFFTSNGRKESVGSYDIYYCTGGHEKWSDPINIGAPINTTMEEKTIYVSKDGKTAYVGGYYEINNQGDSDIYKIDISDLNFFQN
jgi:WD40-like Beta Propeller Repeat.